MRLRVVRGALRLCLCWQASVSVAEAQVVPGEPPSNGPLSGFANQLDDLGLRFRTQLVNENAANPVGGVKQGSTDAGQFLSDIALDTDKVFGLPGGTFMIGPVHDYGESLANQYTGTFTKTQEIFKNHFNQWRVGLLAYDQRLLDRHLDVLVGRFGTTSLYGRLESDGNFESGAVTSVPQTLNSEAGFTFTTSATWAGNVRWDFDYEHAYVQAGAFEVNSFIEHTSGFDFSTRYATGVTVPFEAGIGAFNLDTQRYPFAFKVGGYASTAPFSDPLANTKGEPLGLAGGTAVNSASLRSGLDMLAEKTIWRPAARSPHNLSVFGGWVLPLEDDEVMRAQAFAGLILRGPFKSRPRDIVSFVANYYRMSGPEQVYLDEARTRAGGAGTTFPNEVFFESDYSVFIAPGLRLAPNLQYIVHPDDAELPNTPFVPKNVLVLGLKLTFNVTSFLGFPLAPVLSD